MSTEQFSRDLARFAVTLEQRSRAVFLSTVTKAAQSIIEGSSATGAPGQPVDTGNLRASWQTTFESPTQALISTNVAYAPYVEEGINRWGSVRYKNHGPHSVALTRTNFPRLVEAAIREVGP